MAPFPIVTDRKEHFACFGCRKSFKQRATRRMPLRDWRGRFAGTTFDNRSFPCPECGKPMQVMGKDFKAPPQRDAKQWLKVEVLHSSTRSTAGWKS